MKRCGTVGQCQSPRTGRVVLTSRCAIEAGNPASKPGAAFPLRLLWCEADLDRRAVRVVGAQGPTPLGLGHLEADVRVLQSTLNRGELALRGKQGDGEGERLIKRHPRLDCPAA